VPVLSPHEPTAATPALTSLLISVSRLRDWPLQLLPDSQPGRGHGGIVDLVTKLSVDLMEIIARGHQIGQHYEEGRAGTQRVPMPFWDGCPVGIQLMFVRVLRANPSVIWIEAVGRTRIGKPRVGALQFELADTLGGVEYRWRRPRYDIVVRDAIHKG
jgi:hypothetical protein